MRKFYEDIEQKKEQELLQDMQNRKHHDTLLPTQKSPIPLNRYEELANGDQQVQDWYEAKSYFIGNIRHGVVGNDMTLEISNTNKTSIFDIPKVQGFITYIHFCPKTALPKCLLLVSANSL